MHRCIICIYALFIYVHACVHMFNMRLDYTHHMYTCYAHIITHIHIHTSLYVYELYMGQAVSLYNHAYLLFQRMPPGTTVHTMYTWYVLCTIYLTFAPHRLCKPAIVCTFINRRLNTFNSC